MRKVPTMFVRLETEVFEMLKCQVCRVAGGFTRSPYFFFVSAWGSFLDKE